LIGSIAVSRDRFDDRWAERLTPACRSLRLDSVRMHAPCESEARGQNKNKRDYQPVFRFASGAAGNAARLCALIQLRLPHGGAEID
jgi:hypothetical protein